MKNLKVHLMQFQIACQEKYLNGAQYRKYIEFLLFDKFFIILNLNLKRHIF